MPLGFALATFLALSALAALVALTIREARTTTLGDGEPGWFLGPRALGAGLARLEEITLSALLALLLLLGSYQAVRRNLLPPDIDFARGKLWLWAAIAAVACGLCAALVARQRRQSRSERPALFGLVLSLCALTLFVLHGAVMRLEDAGKLPQNGFWIDELVRYSVFFIGLVGAALATHAVKLINIDLFTRFFGLRGRLVLRLIAGAFSVFACVLLFQGGLVVRTINQRLAEEGELIAPGTAIIALPLAATLIAVHQLLLMAQDAWYLRARRCPPDLQENA